MLLELFGDAREAAAALRQLAGLDPQRWTAVEETLTGMLLKVRGEARATLVELFHERGVVSRAHGDLGRRSAARRARAAEILGVLGHKPAAGELCALLHDRHPDVRIVAARALGRIADPGSAQPLLDSLAAPRPVPSQVVAHALTRIGSPARAALTAGTDHPEPLVRAVAIEVLGITRAVAAADAVAASLRKDESTEVRIRAARALGRLARASALPVLIDALAPGEPDAVRAVAARAIGEVGSPAAAPALGQLLSDQRYRVAHNAAAALLNLGAAGRRELAEAARDGEPPARDHAREALARAALAEARGEPAYREM